MKHSQKEKYSIVTESNSSGTLSCDQRCFFVVLARDCKHVKEKMAELTQMQIPYIIVCGERYNHPNVVYREAKGKWDAINFGAQFIPDNAEIILFNDVDTKIHNIDLALNCIQVKADMVYCRVSVSEGPQVMFYRILNPIRQRFHVCASGEFMLVKRQVFDKVLPVPPCIAEDSYILFRALELGFKAYFCTGAYVTTKRTSNTKDEEAYKTRTTLGIYQALSYSKPSLTIRVFYFLLPAFSPLLIIAGGNGIAWAKGIRKALKASITKKQISCF